MGRPRGLPIFIAGRTGGECLRALIGADICVRGTIVTLGVFAAATSAGSYPGKLDASS